MGGKKFNRINSIKFNNDLWGGGGGINNINSLKRDVFNLVYFVEGKTS